MIGVRLCYSSEESYKANKGTAVEASQVLVKQISAFLGSKAFFAGTVNQSYTIHIIML